MPTCRFCAADVTASFVDLGETPLSNAYLAAEDLARLEPRYPLHARVCSKCLLVQVDSVVPPEEIFAEDYAYFSSFSSSWLAHARAFAQQAGARFELGAGSKVVEVASNDGYLLRHFVQAGVPVLGIDPAAGCAEAARAVGVPTEVAFFGRETAERLAGAGHAADLIAANNVLAHVPDLNDFVAGFPVLLKPDGVLTVECPHLLRLIEETQFDTIYHEHFSYFSLLVIERVFAEHGLRVFDVEELATHGGSLRVYACHAGRREQQDGPGLTRVRSAESAAGLDRLETYRGFQPRVDALKSAMLEFLTDVKQKGERVAAYGAAAKGNTLLNYFGVGQELIEFVVDRSPHKQGKFLPGSHIPILAPDHLNEARPDYLLLLAWNLREEIMEQMAHVREWGTRFVVPIPAVRVLD